MVLEVVDVAESSEDVEEGGASHKVRGRYVNDGNKNGDMDAAVVAKELTAVVDLESSF